MTNKKKTGLVIGAAAACIAVLCAAGACNGTAKEEKAMHRVIVTTTSAASQPTEITTTVLLTTTAPAATTVETTTESQITTMMTCSATEHAHHNILMVRAGGIRKYQQKCGVGSPPFVRARQILDALRNDPRLRKGEDGNPKIVPEEAETVRLIYDLFLNGMTYRQIAETLSERGLKNAKGNTDWTHSDVASILQNEKYTGDALLQKTFVTDCITKKVKKNNGELPMYLVKGHHEAIIDRTTFNRVQTEIARRTSLRKPTTADEKGKYSGKYALTGLVVCGECETAYRRITWDDKNGGKVPVWRCINRLKNGKKFCKCSPTVYEDRLHQAVIDAMNRVFDVEADVKNTLRESIQTVLLPDGQRLTELEKKKADLNKEIGDLLDRSFKENDYTKYDSEFKRLSDELTAVSKEITEEKEWVSECAESVANVKDILDDIERREFRIDWFDDALVRHSVERVTIIDKSTIRVKITGAEDVEI